MEIKIYVHSLSEMDNLANIISEYIRPGLLIGLAGDLGSGKTTFTKFLAKHMGIDANVNSPTFSILKIYQGPLPLYHMDVYRLEDIGYDFELEDFIYGDGVAVIEWYSYVKNMLPDEMLTMDISMISNDLREITIKGSGEYAKIVETISNRYRN